MRRFVTGTAGLSGLVIGLVAMLLLALVVGQTPALGPAVAAQDWELTVEISDALLTARLNADMGNQRGDSSPSADMAINRGRSWPRAKSRSAIPARGHQPRPLPE